MLLKNPGFTLIAVLTLAVGIGANTAIFSVVNAVLIRSLPYRQPDQLVLLKNAALTYSESDSPQDFFSPENRLAWKERVRSFEHLAAVGHFDGGVNLTGSGEPERIEAIDVTANFFSALGIDLVAGRAFLPEEEWPGKNQVAIISSEIWKRRFGQKTDVLGQVIGLNGKSFTVIGIAPPGLQFPRRIDVWVLIEPSLRDRIFTNPVVFHQVFARLKPDVTLEQARAEMTVFSQQLNEQAPASNLKRNPIEVVPLLDELVGNIRPALQILWGAVGLVLLIACANVASLLLAAATARRREMAVRAALGGSRWRLIRLSLVESWLLAGLGGAVGALLAGWLGDLLVALSPPEIPRMDEVTLDGRVFLFALGVSWLTGLIVGGLPALRSSKIDLSEALKNGWLKALPGQGGRSARGLLVIAETALALILLAGAGLLVRSFANVLAIDRGFEPQNILTASLSLPRVNYSNPNQQRAFFQQLLERLQSLAQTDAVALTNKLPLSKANVIGLLFEAENQPPNIPFDERFALYLSVSPDYFRVMGIPLLQGRAFTNQDTANAPPVIAVNEAMARRYFPNGNAIGKRITITREDAPREIVGIVKDVRTLELERPADKEMYLPWLQSGGLPSTLVVRTSADPAALMTAIREAVRSLDPNLPLYDIKTMDRQVSDALAKRRFILWLMSFFAGIALLLTMTGIYGAISYTVAQRTREIGIRMAVGAQASDVLRLMTGQGIKLTVIGIVLGMIGALALTRFMKSLLYEVSAADPLTFGVIALLFAGIASMACYVPARRATRVDPMAALRYE